MISISGELESYSAYRKNQKYHIFKPVVSLSALPTSRGHLPPFLVVQAAGLPGVAVIETRTISELR